MCGLFGYCFTDSQVGELTEEKTKALVDIGIAFNLHRGTDAAGWAAAYDKPQEFKGKSSRLWHAKASGRGDQNLLDPKSPYYPEAVPRSMIVHTRAGTRGSAANNENNHPVVCDHILVTHNGTVSNHHMFRRKHDAVIKTLDVEPDVDSFVLSLLIYTNFPNWQTIEDTAELIRSGLGEIEGPYAFAALNSHQPEWMMLARGRSSPLVMAHHQQRGFMYASESDAIMAALDEIGHDGWKVKDIDEGRLFVLYKGQVVHAQSYTHPARTYHTTYGTNVAREPKIQRLAELDPNIVVSQDAGYTNYAKHWTDHNAPWSVFEINDDDDGQFEWLPPNKWKENMSSTLFEVSGSASAVGRWQSKNSSRISEETTRIFVLFTGPGGFCVEQLWGGNGYKPLDTWFHRGEIVDVRSKWTQIAPVKEVKKHKAGANPAPTDKYEVSTFKFYEYWEGAHTVERHKPLNKKLQWELNEQERKLKDEQAKEERKKLPFRTDTTTNGSRFKQVRSLSHSIYGQFFFHPASGEVPFPSGSCDGDAEHAKLPFLSHGADWIKCEATRYAVFDLIGKMTAQDIERFTGAEFLIFDPFGAEIFEHEVVNVYCRMGHDWSPCDYLDGLAVEWECEQCGSTKVLMTFGEDDLNNYLWAHTAEDRQYILKGGQE